MYRVLIAADVPNWAYDRRATALKKYSPSDFDVTVCYHGSAPGGQSTKSFELGDFDLFYNLCYMTQGFDSQIVKRGLNTVLVISHNRDSKSRLENWKDSYNPVCRVSNGWLVCNNLEVFEHHGRLARTCNISNGYDPDLWYCEKSIAVRPKRVVWCGSENPKKGKGYHDILLPLAKSLNKREFECDFRAFPTGGNLQAWAYPYQKQFDWYQNAFCVVCASEHEGTPNFVTEGAACGCVVVSSNVGNIREWGRHEYNCIICDRTVEAFEHGILQAWDWSGYFSTHGMETMEQDWTYGRPGGNRAAYFFQLFRRLIEDGADSIQQFSYAEKQPEEI